ncbi:MAG: tRNA (adenosine(37)-N6)-threonylcarbamoyltransferase complex ATPase subunit type 1 TsaE [Candidatus Saccharimonadales bacterium]
MKKQIITTSAEATIKLAEAIGRKLRGGEVIELSSDVGGGKTTFVKGLARGTETTDNVASPTFVLNKVYKGKNGVTIDHFDFYRLNDPGIMQDSLADVLKSGSVVVVEWSDKVANVLPTERLQVKLQVEGKNQRNITLKAVGAKHEKLIKDLI